MEPPSKAPAVEPDKAKADPRIKEAVAAAMKLEDNFKPVRPDILRDYREEAVLYGKDHVGEPRNLKALEDNRNQVTASEFADLVNPGKMFDGKPFQTAARAKFLTANGEAERNYYMENILKADIRHSAQGESFDPAQVDKAVKEQVRAINQEAINTVKAATVQHQSIPGSAESPNPSPGDRASITRQKMM
jgi:hypothetical protein